MLVKNAHRKNEEEIYADSKALMYEYACLDEEELNDDEVIAVKTKILTEFCDLLYMAKDAELDYLIDKLKRMLSSCIGSHLDLRAFRVIADKLIVKNIIKDGKEITSESPVNRWLGDNAPEGAFTKGGIK